MKRKLTEGRKEKRKKQKRNLKKNGKELKLKGKKQKKMRIAKEEADMKAQEIAYQLQRMEEEARDREIEMEEEKNCMKKFY